MTNKMPGEGETSLKEIRKKKRDQWRRRITRKAHILISHECNMFSRFFLSVYEMLTPQLPLLN